MTEWKKAVRAPECHRQQACSQAQETVFDPGRGIASGNWLNSIGNLMLISGHHNRVIGNKEFSTKVQSYGERNLSNQQREIISFVKNQKSPVWDVEAIKTRQNKIINAAKEIWGFERI